MNRHHTAHDPIRPTAHTETGWWDQDGFPAPWPDDFPNNWRPETANVTPEPGQPPF